MPIKPYITRNSVSCESENTIAKMLGLYILKKLHCVLQSNKFTKLNCLSGSELNGPFKLKVDVGQCWVDTRRKGKNYFTNRNSYCGFRISVHRVKSSFKIRLR